MIQAAGRLRRRSNGPRGLLGMVALVAIVELVLAGQDAHLTPDLPASWRHAGAAATREASRVDLLAFGDSLVKFGVLPTVLDAALGGRSYNLAVHAGPPSAACLLLRRALDAGARPRALVVDFGPHQLARDARHPEFRRCWPELASVAECLDLARATHDAGFLGSLILGKALPSYRVRYEVRAQAFAALDGGGWSARGAVRALRRNWEANQGAQALARKPGDLGEVPLNNDGLFPASWQVNPVALADVHRFLSLASGRGIVVYWLLPPLSPGVQARRDELALDEPFDRLVRDVQARFPSVTIVDARRAGYTADVFVDAVHLDRDGAAALTADLASVIAADRAGEAASQFVRLPTYRPREINGPIEDLEESVLALRDARRGVRRE